VFGPNVYRRFFNRLLAQAAGAEINDPFFSTSDRGIPDQVKFVIGPRVTPKFPKKNFFSIGVFRSEKKIDRDCPIPI
jgi:hypothetical protein